MRRPVIPLHSRNLQVIHGRNFDRSSEHLEITDATETEPQVERRQKNLLTVGGRDGEGSSSRGVSQVSGYSGSSVSQVSYCHSTGMGAVASGDGDESKVGLDIVSLVTENVTRCSVYCA